MNEKGDCKRGQREFDEVELGISKKGKFAETQLASNHLREVCTQHPVIERKLETKEESQDCMARLSDAVKTILECIGEDPDREGLKDTPERYAKAMLFLTKGYKENIDEVVNKALFQEECDGIVIVKDLEFYSLCEHHILPFGGKMHIGYIPSGKVIGISKIVRIVDMFSKRLQVQERLTKQVAAALSEILQPEGVGVVVEASHNCMAMRGVQKSGAVTTTSCTLGCLQSTESRREFQELISKK